MATLSVVIPTYERAAELACALDLLVAQCCKDFEAAVCDDGSREDIESVVAWYAGRLPVKYVRLENSGGGPRGRATS